MGPTIQFPDRRNHCVVNLPTRFREGEQRSEVGRDYAPPAFSEYSSGVEDPPDSTTATVFGKELTLDGYETRQAEGAMSVAALAKMVRGVSCRDCADVADTARAGFGVKKGFRESATTRRFIAVRSTRFAMSKVMWSQSTNRNLRAA
ncbi:MAG: hypothetical protein R3C59_28815 [Planctomycetaceae bacterium]